MFIYPLLHTGKFLYAAEVIFGVTKWKGERGPGGGGGEGLIQNKSQFNCVRKKDNSKKKHMSSTFKPASKNLHFLELT